MGCAVTLSPQAQRRQGAPADPIFSFILRAHNEKCINVTFVILQLSTRCALSEFTEGWKLLQITASSSSKEAKRRENGETRGRQSSSAVEARLLCWDARGEPCYHFWCAPSVGTSEPGTLVLWSSLLSRTVQNDYFTWKGIVYGVQI